MENLNKLNPWWFYSNWEKKDRNLTEWVTQQYKWFPKWIEQVSLTPFSLNFVYGPRQVGKTTGIKILIKELLEKKNVDPENIIYLDLDFIVSLNEFRRIMEGIITSKKGHKGIFYIFLDEVSSIEEWWRILKFYIDQGEFKNDVITVSGSSTLGISKSPEKFPGRKGNGKEVIVLPLSFPEFVSIKGYEKRDLLYDISLLSKVFDEYKRQGGFPKSINSNPDASEALIDGIISEIHKHEKNARIVQDILYSLLGKIPSAVSYNSIATDIGISHNTVSEYLDFLSDLLLIGIAYWKGERIDRKKEKKVFFRDPFLLHALSYWVNQNYNESALLENIIQEHLYRKYGEVYYFKNKTEVDVIAGEYKIEIKKTRPHRGYPKNVIVLNEEEIPRFLLELEFGSH